MLFVKTEKNLYNYLRYNDFKRYVMNIRKLMPTKFILELQFYHHFRRFFSWKNPKSLNEKVQWLKVNNRNEEYIKLVDKIQVKDYVCDKIGAKYIIPTYGVWDNATKIDFTKLPEKFVLKCNHDSHCVFMCTDKNKFDINRAVNTLNKRLKYNHYWYGREWPYKYVKPRILAEQLLENNDGSEVVDYKIMCFNGKVDDIMVCSGRNANKLRYYYFDREWKLLRYQDVDKDLPEDFSLKKPEKLEEMFKLSEQLAYGKPLVRVDWYEVNGQLFFGELTFFPCAGFDTDITAEVDYKLGERLNLYDEEGGEY